MRATRALIHLENLRFNINEIRKKVRPETELCIPVKANAYGHGAVRIAQESLRAGVSFFGVASVQEGVELREAGIEAHILSFSLPIPEEIPLLAEYNLTPLVADAQLVEAINAAAAAMNKTVSVHIKIDTGMGRIGCRPDDALQLAKLITEKKNLVLGGVASHLSVSDSCGDNDAEFTKRQIDVFNNSINSIKKAGIDPGILHASASGGILQYQEAHFDMVRPGIMVYGYPPSQETEGLIQLKPVMELETRIVAVKRVPEHTPVSYGRTWTAEKETCIATLPVGYADGLARRLSPGLSVRVKDNLYPIAGRICMDQCMIDIGQEPDASLWDRVVIFGPGPKDNTAATLARMLETIPYEITCGISARVPRIYTDSGN